MAVTGVGTERERWWRACWPNSISTSAEQHETRTPSISNVAGLETQCRCLRAALPMPEIFFSHSKPGCGYTGWWWTSRIDGTSTI